MGSPGVGVRQAEYAGGISGSVVRRSQHGGNPAQCGRQRGDGRAVGFREQQYLQELGSRRTPGYQGTETEWVREVRDTGQQFHGTREVECHREVRRA